MFNKNIIILIICLFSQATQAQKAVVPGYQGKRFTAEINVNSIPSLGGYNANFKVNSLSPGDYSAEFTSRFAFSTRFEGALTYTIGRHLSLVGEYGFGKTGVTANGVKYLSSDGFEYFGEGFYQTKFNHIGLGVLFQKSKKWGLAPIGPYWGMKILKVSGKADYQKVRDPNDGIWKETCTCNVLENGDTGVKASLAGAQFTFGTKKVIFENFIYNIGVNFSAVGFSKVDSGLEAMEQAVTDRLAVNYIMYFHFGGGMLF